MWGTALLPSPCSSLADPPVARRSPFSSGPSAGWKGRLTKRSLERFPDLDTGGRLPGSTEAAVGVGLGAEGRGVEGSSQSVAFQRRKTIHWTRSPLNGLASVPRPRACAATTAFTTCPLHTRTGRCGGRRRGFRTSDAECARSLVPRARRALGGIVRRLKSGGSPLFLPPPHDWPPEHQRGRTPT